MTRQQAIETATRQAAASNAPQAVLGMLLDRTGYWVVPVADLGGGRWPVVAMVQPQELTR
jgi:hypothetical protein